MSLPSNSVTRLTTQATTPSQQPAQTPLSSMLQSRLTPSALHALSILYPKAFRMS